MLRASSLAACCASGRCPATWGSRPLVDTTPPALQGVAPQVTISFSVTWRPGVLTRLQMPMSVFLETLINVRSRRDESAPPILFFPLFDPRLLLCRLFW